LTYAQILALPNPQDGDLVYDVTNQAFSVFNGKRFVLFSQPAGTFQWAKSIEGTNDFFGHDFVLDNASNIYMVGDFSGTIGFGGLFNSLTSAGSSDIFMVKYNSNG
jgi:hypothetical protein